MNILIKNCNLISMCGKRDRYESDVDIHIEGNKIKEIGKELNVNGENIKIIDATGKVVMPGLINTHSHLPMSIFRETLDGLNLQDWLGKEIWPMEDKLTSEDVYNASMLSGVEMIRTGTTMVNDMYFFTDDIIKALMKLGVRLQTTRTLMNASGSGEKRIQELENMIQKYKGRYDALTFNVGIHGLYTSNEEYIKKCTEFAKRYNLPVHLHFCENSQEVEDIKKKYGVSPVNVLEKYFLGVHTILAHAVKLNGKDIEKLSKLDVHISHCPVSNLKLGCGVAKVYEMLNNNINISLGTDGQGSGSNLDMFETMKFTALLQKGINESPEVIPAYEALKMATVNGAKALGVEEVIGTIEEGKLADLIILNMDSEIMQPVNNVFADIVYNCKGTNVETSIINGQVVMENKEILGLDEHKIYRECNKTIERIKFDKQR